MSLSFAYDGVLQTSIAGSRIDPTTGTTLSVYDFQQSFNGLVPNVQSVAFDPIDVSTTPTWTTQHLQRDSAGRPTTWSLYAGDIAPDALIAKETRLYRKDDRVLAGVRSWQAPSASGSPELTWGALQIAGYDGKKRLTGLRLAEASTSASVADWETWLGVDANLASLQDVAQEPSAVTNDPMLGGAWTRFERSKLGTLTAELSDNKSWRATTY